MLKQINKFDISPKHGIPSDCEHAAVMIVAAMAGEPIKAERQATSLKCCAVMETDTGLKPWALLPAWRRQKWKGRAAKLTQAQERIRHLVSTFTLEHFSEQYCSMCPADAGRSSWSALGHPRQLHPHRLLHFSSSKPSGFPPSFKTITGQTGQHPRISQTPSRSFYPTRPRASGRPFPPYVTISCTARLPLPKAGGTRR